MTILISARRFTAATYINAPVLAMSDVRRRTRRTAAGKGGRRAGMTDLDLHDESMAKDGRQYLALVEYRNAVQDLAGVPSLKEVASEYKAVLSFFFQAEDGIRDLIVTGVQTCALPISVRRRDDAERVSQIHREGRSVGTAFPNSKSGCTDR